MTEAIHHEVTFQTTPERLYEILMDSREHGAFTGSPAEISKDVGGSFQAHGGRIEGRNIELVPGKRIVQAWRPANWPAGQYSLVRFELEPAAQGTKVTLTHDATPEEQRPHFDAGWTRMYWEPLAKYLA